MKTKNNNAKMTRNVLAGFGSILSFVPANPRRPTIKRLRLTAEQIEAKAWKMVGESFCAAVGRVCGGSRSSCSHY